MAREPQSAFPPDDASNFLYQMLLGRAMRRMLLGERTQQCGKFRGQPNAASGQSGGINCPTAEGNPKSPPGNKVEMRKKPLAIGAAARPSRRQSRNRLTLFSKLP